MTVQFQAMILAREFVDTLREHLTPAQFEMVRTRNSLPDYDGVCASHDFCDANMAMHEAFERTMGRSPLPDNDDEMTDHDITLWNSAWEIARNNQLVGG